MTSDLPLVSAVVPCRNERRFICAAIESLLASDYPAALLEIVVVDGLSTDGTRELIQPFVARRAIVLIDNPSGTIPAAMNLGIRAARGSVVLKIDAHATYPRDYVSRCITLLREHGAENVGGVLVTLPSAPTLIALAIARVLAHPFGSGNSRFRIGVGEPVWADTAAFGCYPRDVLERLGGYDERLVRSSDIDLNARLRQSGGRVLLAPAIQVRYFPAATLGSFVRRNVIDGYWAVYPLRYGSRFARTRHIAPLVVFAAACVVAAAAPLVPGAALAMLLFGGAYAAAALVGAGHLAWGAGRPGLLPLAPFLFALRHAAYAVGSCVGMIRVITAAEFWERHTVTRRRGADVA